VVTGKKYSVTYGTLRTPVASGAGHGGATVSGLPQTGGAALHAALTRRASLRLPARQQ
jgi:hypothetical protein